MKNLTIGQRIGYGFGAILVIILALCLVVGTRVKALRDGAGTLAGDTIPSLGWLAENKFLSSDNRALVYKHIASSSAQDMDQCEARIKANVDQISKNYENYKGNASDLCLVHLNKAQQIREDVVKARTEILKASRAATNAEASAAVYELCRKKLDAAVDAYDAEMELVQAQEKKEATDSEETMYAAAKWANVCLVAGAVSALLLAVLIGMWIVNNTNSVLKRVSATLMGGAEQVTSAAGQVSSSSQSLAEGSSSQAASVEETSASLEETASMAKRNSENSAEATRIAKEARTAADRGVADMATMSTAMTAIKASSDDVAKILRTIDEIAFQTNILALNAAVEAARAGEAGMGFAVVADEVRNLAQRSATAAKETAAKIETAIKSTAEGVSVSGKVASALNEITDKIRQVDDLAAEVATASKEQTSGIAQINMAVSQMDKITQSNAANAEESAAAAEELSSQAIAMREAVTELLQLVSGAASPGGNRSAAPVNHPVLKKPKTPPAVTIAQAGKDIMLFGDDQASRPASSAAKAAAARDAIPLESAFKDF